MTHLRQIKPLQVILNVITIKAKLLCMTCMALHDMASFSALTSSVFGLFSSHSELLWARVGLASFAS